MNDFQKINKAIQERNARKRRFRIRWGRWNILENSWDYLSPVVTLYELKFHGWEWCKEIKQ